MNKRITKKVYTIKRRLGKQIDRPVSRLIYEAGLILSKSEPCNWTDFPLRDFADKHLLLVCYKHKQPVGFLMASFGENLFDSSIKTLSLNVLFSLPNTRSTYLLLKEFIDIGKTNANHTISVIRQNTNIKPRSLERLGFHLMEKVYLMRK